MTPPTERRSSSRARDFQDFVISPISTVIHCRLVSRRGHVFKFCPYLCTAPS